MENTAKEEQQQATNVVSSGKSKLRYPLRSAGKVKEEKADLPNSSSSRRARVASTVSKSVSALDLSGKEKSVKPPRRLSNPAKSISPGSKPTGFITPISETRPRRTNNVAGKSETPASAVPRASTARKKYDVLASASYWLDLVKKSESVGRHNISIGLFKLALEAKCEPLQKIQIELKSYIRRHDLSELGGSVKEVLESYNIPAEQEQVQVSETCSQVPEEGTRSSDEETHSTSSAVESKKLRVRSLNADSSQASSAVDSTKRETSQKSNNTANKARVSAKKPAANSRLVSETGSNKVQKNSQNITKQDSNKERDKIKPQGKKPVTNKGSFSPPATKTAPQENKENLDELGEEIRQAEVV